MNRLFVRLFLSVWLASALIGAFIAVIEAGWRAPASEAAEDRVARRLIAIEASALLELDGPARDARLAALRDETGLQLVVFDADGHVVVGDAPTDAMRALARRGSEASERAYDAVLVSMMVANGHVAVARRPARPTWARALGTDTFALRAVIVLLVSGLIAFALARYLSRPLDRLRRATGRVADGDLSTRVAPSLAGSPAEVAALARDFDRMVARVETLLASRDRLLSDVSHELGSPLARLRVALELARGKADVAAAPMLDRIEREASRLGALVDEILTLRRLEDGAVVRADVDLVELVSEIGRDAALEASESEVRLDLVVPDRVDASGDRELLRRAIENVVRNAIHHAPEGTEVEVTLTRGDGLAVVAVRDHGPGVAAAEDRDRMFEPLVRLDASRDARTGGRGLGLAIAKRAVEAHGGAIAADEAPGGGLLVTLVLPLHAPSHDLT